MWKSHMDISTQKGGAKLLFIFGGEEKCAMLMNLMVPFQIDLKVL